MSDAKSNVSSGVNDAGKPGAPVAPAEHQQAWEELHAGAYVPIRVRGSWRGGVLG